MCALEANNNDDTDAEWIPFRGTHTNTIEFERLVKQGVQRNVTYAPVPFTLGVSFHGAEGTGPVMPGSVMDRVGGIV